MQRRCLTVFSEPTLYRTRSSTAHGFLHSMCSMISIVGWYASRSILRLPRVASWVCSSNRVLSDAGLRDYAPTTGRDAWAKTSRPERSTQAWPSNIFSRARPTRTPRMGVATVLSEKNCTYSLRSTMFVKAPGGLRYCPGYRHELAFG